MLHCVVHVQGFQRVKQQKQRVWFAGWAVTTYCAPKHRTLCTEHAVNILLLVPQSLDVKPKFDDFVCEPSVSSS